MASMTEKLQKLVLDTVKGSFESGDYSDLVITCGADTYHVHKMIVCNRAEFFARAVKFGGKESAEGKIDLPEDEPAVIKLLITYLYEGDYEPCLSSIQNVADVAVSTNESFNIVRGAKFSIWGFDYTYEFPHTCRRKNGALCCESGQHCVCPHHTCSVDCMSYSCKDFLCPTCTRPNPPTPPLPSTHLLLHAKMYKIGDQYAVSGLQSLASEKFRLACTALWNSDAFPVAAHHAFSTTPEDDKGLRDVVSGTIAEHMGLIHKPAVAALMAEFNGLSLGILKKKAEEHGWGEGE